MATPAYGWTGKLPAHSDFITGGAYSPFLAGIRAWFSQGMAAARAQGLNLDAFLTTPFARLVASPVAFGGLGGLALFGPGMDRVGRAFPFALVVETGKAPIARSSLEDTVFDAMETAFLEALDPARGDAALGKLSAPKVPVSRGDEENFACLAAISDCGHVKRFAAKLRPDDFTTLFEGASQRGVVDG